MSFSEFFRWLFGLLGSQRKETEQTSSSPIDTQVGANNHSSHNTSSSSGSDAHTSGSDSSDNLTRPTSPEPEIPITPKLVALTTATDTLTLYEATEFRVKTEPQGHYDNIEIKLEATNARVIKPFDKTTGIIVLQFNQRSRHANETHTVIATDGEVEVRKTVTVSLLKLLWNNHAGRKNLCDADRFRNQCAVRMGAALELSSIKLPTDRKKLRRCCTEYRIYDEHKEDKVKGHVLAAQELANWVKSASDIFGERHICHSKEEIEGRTGVIFFRDGWDTTDHIDIWDGKRLVGGFPSYFQSDFKDLWFWDVY